MMRGDGTCRPGGGDSKHGSAPLPLLPHAWRLLAVAAVERTAWMRDCLTSSRLPCIPCVNSTSQGRHGSEFEASKEEGGILDEGLLDLLAAAFRTARQSLTSQDRNGSNVEVSKNARQLNLVVAALQLKKCTSRGEHRSQAQTRTA
eukprot:1151676-Pelagomonas_calceolata.AAC.8